MVATFNALHLQLVQFADKHGAGGLEALQLLLVGADVLEQLNASSPGPGPAEQQKAQQAKPCREMRL